MLSHEASTDLTLILCNKNASSSSSTSLYAARSREKVRWQAHSCDKSTRRGKKRLNMVHTSSSGKATCRGACPQTLQRLVYSTLHKQLCRVRHCPAHVEPIPMAVDHLSLDNEEKPRGQQRLLCVYIKALQRTHAVCTATFDRPISVCSAHKGEVLCLQFSAYVKNLHGPRVLSDLSAQQDENELQCASKKIVWFRQPDRSTATCIAACLRVLRKDRTPDLFGRQGRPTQQARASN